MNLKTEIGLPVAATPPSQKVMATPRRRLGNRPPLAVGKMRRGRRIHPSVTRRHRYDHSGQLLFSG